MHGGSGLGWGRRDVEGAEVPELLDMQRQLREQREREARAMRAAGKPKAR